MQQNLRKSVIATFVTITIIFVILNTYTSYTYFTVYKALRDFNITVQEFHLEFLNATIRTSTVISVHNPSECTFKALNVVERLSLHGQFMLIEGLYMYEQPLHIGSMSTVNVTIQGEIKDEEKTEWVKEWYTEDWVAEIRVLVDGPLVGTFLHDEWTTIKLTR